MSPGTPPVRILQDEPLPDVLYHYTTLGGFLGIMKTGKLWASDLRFLNDSSEIVYALDRIKELVSVWKQNHSIQRMEQIVDLLDVGRRLHSSIFGGIFSFSLSEKGDLLSQWRGYAPGGDGVAVGFVPADLRAVASGQGFRLVKCRYSENERPVALRELVVAIMREWEALLKTSNEPAKDAIGVFLNEQIIPRLFEVAPAIKHPSFAEEAEWRVVSTYPDLPAPDSAHFRVVEGRIVPYVEFDLASHDPDAHGARAPIYEVFVGPGPNSELTAKGIDVAILSNWRLPVRIRPSAIPFR